MRANVITIYAYKRQDWDTLLQEPVSTMLETIEMIILLIVNSIELCARLAQSIEATKCQIVDAHVKLFCLF